MSSSPQKFAFDTVFDEDGAVVSQPAPRKAFYTAQEVEQARAKAFAEGQAAALDQAQMAMVQVAKDLAAKGEIMLAGQGGEDELIY